MPAPSWSPCTLLRYLCCPESPHFYFSLFTFPFLLHLPLLLIYLFLPRESQNHSGRERPLLEHLEENLADFLNLATEDKHGTCLDLIATKPSPSSHRAGTLLVHRLRPAMQGLLALGELINNLLHGIFIFWALSIKLELSKSICVIRSLVTDPLVFGLYPLVTRAFNTFQCFGMVATLPAFVLFLSPEIFGLVFIVLTCIFIILKLTSK